MNEQARRRKAVPISPQLLYDLFTKGKPRYIQCIEGLPDNARFIGEHYDVQRDVYYLVFESDEWDAIPFGQQLPTLTPHFRQFHITSLLTRAETMFAAQYGPEAEQWLKEWRALKDELL